MYFGLEYHNLSIFVKPLHRLGILSFCSQHSSACIKDVLSTFYGSFCKYQYINYAEVYLFRLFRSPPEAIHLTGEVSRQQQLIVLMGGRGAPVEGGCWSYWQVMNQKNLLASPKTLLPREAAVQEESVTMASREPLAKMPSPSASWRMES